METDACSPVAARESEEVLSQSTLLLANQNCASGERKNMKKVTEVGVKLIYYLRES